MGTAPFPACSHWLKPGEEHTLTLNWYQMFSHDFIFASSPSHVAHLIKPSTHLKAHNGGGVMWKPLTPATHSEEDQAFCASDLGVESHKGTSAPSKVFISHSPPLSIFETVSCSYLEHSIILAPSACARYEKNVKQTSILRTAMDFSGTAWASLGF